VEQTITHFAMDDEPVAVGTGLRYQRQHGTQAAKIAQAAAANSSDRQSEDEFFLVEFNDQPKMVVPLTRNVEEIQNQLTWAQSKGRTALLDAIFLALHEMKKSTKNKQGAADHLRRRRQQQPLHGERSQEPGARERRADLRHRRVRGDNGRGRTTEEAGGPGLLNDLASRPAAATCRPRPSELPDIAAKIGVELRNRYVLGILAHQPSSATAGITRASQSGAAEGPARAAPVLRRGYYAPAE
jgi:Ca-activated chloride channel family protein